MANATARQARQSSRHEATSTDRTAAQAAGALILTAIVTAILGDGLLESAVGLPESLVHAGTSGAKVVGDLLVAVAS